MSEERRLELWVEERQDTSGARFRVKRVLFSGKSEFQRVDVVETEGHGRMLLNDGLVMLSERDEAIYHEMIAHVPLFVHPNPERVLIIGGGDGGTAREVLRHASVKKCVMVEIDAMVVEACREHIPQTAACLGDPRLTLLIEDGVRFAAETKERFDVALIDSTDPIGPATPLFGTEFYRNVHRLLADGGIVVAQGESPFYHAETQVGLHRILSGLFRETRFYNFTNMTYPGGLWSFLYASKGLSPLDDFDPERVKRSGMRFHYYTPEMHRAAFAIPAFARDRLKT